MLFEDLHVGRAEAASTAFPNIVMGIVIFHTRVQRSKLNVAMNEVV
jgi:hypothetical protein